MILRYHHGMTFLSLAVCLGPIATQAATLADTVACTEIAFSQSAERRDPVAFARFLDPDIRMIANNTMRGTEAVLAGWATYFENDGPSIQWRPATVEVNAAGTLALSRGPYWEQSRIDGQLVERWGSYISVWRLSDDGNWRLIFDTGADHGKTPSDAERQLMTTTADCSSE